MRHYLKNERGFTMIELIISMFVLVILFTAVTNILQVLSAQEETVAESEETKVHPPAELNLEERYKKLIQGSIIFVIITVSVLGFIGILISQLQKRTENEQPLKPEPEENMPSYPLITRVENSIMHPELKEKFRLVAEQMNRLQPYDDVLDVETKHLIDYSLTNDLNRLLLLYEELNGEQKVSLNEDIESRLDLMNEKVHRILMQLANKKEIEIRKTLHLFDKRYKI